MAYLTVKHECVSLQRLTTRWQMLALHGHKMLDCWAPQHLISAAHVHVRACWRAVTYWTVKCFFSIPAENTWVICAHHRFRRIDQLSCNQVTEYNSLNNTHSTQSVHSNQATVCQYISNNGQLCTVRLETTGLAENQQTTLQHFFQIVYCFMLKSLIAFQVCNNNSCHTSIN